MSKKQSILTNFFRSKRSNGSSSSPNQSDEESSYLPSKSRRMFETPMQWTRVKRVTEAADHRMTIFDVEQDIMADKSLKQVRKDAVREVASLLFDPETYKSIQDSLTTESHRVDPKQLLEYAKGASKIRSAFSLKASEYDADSGTFIAHEERPQPRFNQRQPPPLL